jgi:hypothetical protein
MPELAEVVRRFGAAYLERYGPGVLPSHRAAMAAIAACRTAVLGGQVWRCTTDGCTSERYAYHSCRNRSCPKCHAEQTDRWLARHRARLPECSWVLLTFTLPSELRSVTRSHQRVVLGALMRCAASAVLSMCRDACWLGAVPAILAVLHTWTRSLVAYHPHVHLLLSLGGLDEEDRWVTPRHADYLVPAKALAEVFRGMMAGALRKARLVHRVPRGVFSKAWVVDAEHAGNGDAVLGYLSRYVHRVALSNSQIDAVTDEGVTFHWRDRSSGTLRSSMLSPLTFLSRFLQHVLPKRFAKVRSYGLLAPRNRARLEAARAQLSRSRTTKAKRSRSEHPAVREVRCPRCRARMLPVRSLPPRRGPP